MSNKDGREKEVIEKIMQRKGMKKRIKCKTLKTLQKCLRHGDREEKKQEKKVPKPRSQREVGIYKTIPQEGAVFYQQRPQRETTTAGQCPRR